MMPSTGRHIHTEMTQKKGVTKYAYWMVEGVHSSICYSPELRVSFQSHKDDAINWTAYTYRNDPKERCDLCIINQEMGNFFVGLGLTLVTTLV